MNLKRNLLKAVIIAMFVISIIAQGSGVYAAQLADGGKAYFGLEALMTKTNVGYSMHAPNTNNASRIWNIIRYTDGNYNQYYEGKDANIYCLKSNVGFAQDAVSGKRQAEYDTYYNMKTERDSIKAHNTVLQGLVEENIQDTGVNRYNAILALLDRLYLPGESTETDKTALINKILAYAGTPESPYNSYVDLMEMFQDKFTDDDINAIQQAALWYLTNSTTKNDKYDKLENVDGSWIFYSTTGDDSSYKQLNSYTPNQYGVHDDEGQARCYLGQALYRMLIEEAKENASAYENIAEQSEAPAKVETQGALQGKVVGSNYVLGPIKITESTKNKAPYTIDFQVNKEYKLSDENGTEITNKTIEALVKEGKDIYFTVPTNTQIDTIEATISVKYNDKTMTLWSAFNDSSAVRQPLVEVTTKPVEPTPVKLTFTPKKVFDLALRKYITKINGTEVKNTRKPSLEVTDVSTGASVEYKHRKDPEIVSTDDIITYEITIYNEGQKAGRANKIVDQLPTGLEFQEVISDNFEQESYDKGEGGTNTLVLKRVAENEDNLDAYVSGSNPDSETIEITCKVVGVPANKENTVLTNVAWISEAYNDADKQPIVNEKIETSDFADVDSTPGVNPSTEAPNVTKDNMSDYTGNTSNPSDLSDPDQYYKGQEDDDDFEKVVILPEELDLRLKKFITAVNDQSVPERIKDIDVSKLNTLDSNGKLITDAEFDMNKDAVPVKLGDIVTYTFRVYNEGFQDGYAEEITEDVPEGLEYLYDNSAENEANLTDAEKEAIEYNETYLWGFKPEDIDANGKITKITTNYLSKAANETGNLIKAFGQNDGNKTKDDLKYVEVSVKFKVISDDMTGGTIRNEACISKEADKNGDPVEEDRDSDPDEWKKYEDDEDYDNVILQSFDLALRKFIIAISNDEQVEDSEYLRNADGKYQREPVVDTSKLNTVGEDGKLVTTATYTHSKEPVTVGPENYVIYMLRVYNEGNVDGYAGEIKDHLPSTLEFVDNEFNQQYGWEVSEDGRTVTTRYLEDKIIHKAMTIDSTEPAEDTTYTINNYGLDYQDVPIMCKVSANAKSDDSITNIADITEYLDQNGESGVTDRDSQEDNVKLPNGDNWSGYNDHQQDDDDFEKLVIKTFDLALRKWVTQAIVIDNGKQTVTQTGHQPYDDPEQVVKVEIKAGQLNKVTVKFRYSIRVTNEGDIEGYAKEVTDYVPSGLKFVAEDNPGWTDEGNNVISTRLLENTLLKPGEYADIDVVLTWINNENGLGSVLENTAEISEDYNEYGVPDKDSTPDNKKTGEDDLDVAPVLLSIKTGQARIYFTLCFTVLISTAVGIIIIKKYVL